MPVIPIDTLEDPRIAPYRNLKDRELSRLGDRFIAEGENVALRLLRSTFPTESVLIADRKLDAVRPHVPEEVPLYVIPNALIHDVVGFKYHIGVLAVGRRLPSPTLDEAIPAGKDRLTIVVCPEVSNTDNLGALIRIAAGLGADAMLLGEHCCDPFYRQSVRVSMGTVFYLPVVRSDDLKRDLRRLREVHRVELAATVLDPDAEPLPSATRGPRLALLFGNEAQGLPPDLVALCDRRITLPMQLETDSLNVSIAAGIFLYHFTR